jgi:hypothetical protein
MSDPQWETRLRPVYIDVTDQLCPRRNRLPARLYGAGLINSDEEQKLKLSSKADTELAEEILGILRTQPPPSFDKFCDVLKKVNDASLNAVEKLLRPPKNKSNKEESSSQDDDWYDEADPKEVVKAVLEEGPDRWYDIGRELGFKGGQLDDLVAGQTRGEQRLRRIIDEKINKVGEKKAIRALLNACASISSPIIGSVRDTLDL